MEPTQNKNQQYFFFALLAVVAIFVVLIFLPYLSALVIALVFSIIFRPVQKAFVRIFSPSLAAFATIIVIITVVFTPLVFLGIRMSSEAQSVYIYLTTEGNQADIIAMVNDVVLSVGHKVLGYYPDISAESINIAGSAQKLLSWSFTNLDSIVSNAAKFGFNIFILLIALYYMLRDGGTLRKSIIALSPLVDAYDEEIFKKLEQAVISLVRGSLGVSIVQGCLTMLGFWIFGVPNPILWGAVASIASLIPGIGTALIIIPAVGFLYINGAVIAAGGLLLWGIVAVGLVDNFLGPYLVQRGVHVHEFLILLSVVGGLAFFGPIGFILGPLTLSLLFSLLEIYRVHIRRI